MYGNHHRCVHEGKVYHRKKLQGGHRWESGLNIDCSLMQINLRNPW